MIASVQKILSVEPVVNSDFLEKVLVLGWQVIVKKGEFAQGDLCVYVELDSLLPDGPEWCEFMRPRGFRVRSIRLRGELSQGIVFPISILPDEELFMSEGEEMDAYEGIDVSEILGITHYEKPVPVESRGLMRGNFPPYIPKTDEPLIQSVPDVLNELKGIDVYSTVKCNGTSITISYKDGDFQICSRNNSLKIEGNENNVYIQTALKYDLDKKLPVYGKNIALQGELVGPGIQKNHLGLKEHKILMFNAYDIDNRKYFNYNELLDICFELSLESVPYIDHFKFDFTMEQLLDMANGYYSNTKNLREGIVIRPLEELYSRAIRGRMSFKILNNEYLVKEKE